MKKFILSVCLVAASGAFSVSAQDFTYRLKAGFNIGGTAPLPLPGEIRKIKRYTPTMSFAIGGDVVRNLNERWGILTGLRFETKGMSTDATVKGYKLTISITEGGETGEMSGYFTGDVKTKVKNEYLTLPVGIVYNISPAFELNGGLFMSVRLRGEFTGDAYDGGDGAYIRDRTPVGTKVGVESASYDLSHDLRRFNWGFMLGTHWHAYRQFSLYADFTMAVNSIFPSGYETISFDMYNIYLNIGFAYIF